MRAFASLACVLPILVLTSSAATADTIVAASAHIASPTGMIDFSANVVPNFQPVSNEFMAQGIQIQNSQYFTTAGGSFGVGLGGGFLTDGTLTGPTLTIQFASAVTAASFTYHQVGPTDTTMTALLNSVVVESLVYSGGDNQSANGSQVFGFENILFDELRVSHGAWNFDNLAYSTLSTFADLCSGDGGNQMGCTDCPCNNNTMPGTIGGCINSTGGSARLNATGNPSVSLPSGSALDLRFGVSGIPANAFCILTSGDNLAPSDMASPCFGLGNGVQATAFDGLSCAIMNTRRHGGRAADDNGLVGVTNNPWGGEGGPPVGIAVAGSGFVTGQTRYFQVIHRDEPLAICLRGLNTTQASGVTFTP